MIGPCIASRFGGRDWMLRRRIQLFLLSRTAGHRGLSETQITNGAQNKLLQRIAAILTAAGPRIRAGTWPPTEKAPLESVRHHWSGSTGRVSHDAFRVNHEAVTRLQRVVTVVRRRTHVEGQGNVPSSGRVVSWRKGPFAIV